MSETMSETLHPGRPGQPPGFPHAPGGWTTDHARALAGAEGLELGDDHWEAVRALQEYFLKNETLHVRELHDALDERFHAKGGTKYCYLLFPGGPIAQGCRVAGLKPPAGSKDESFGSVQ